MNQLFRSAFVPFSVFLIGIFWLETGYADKASSAPSQNQATVTASRTGEQKRAIEEVNSLIVDSYTARLDKVLLQLYSNIEAASRGNKKFQIRALEKVRDDLDARLDLIAESNITLNRKKILTGVYLYLKTNIDERAKEIAGE